MSGIGFENIVHPALLFVAWELFRRGKSGRRDVMFFERHLEDNIFALHADLAAGAYCHGQYHRFHIFDPKHRIIHKATVRDRVVHHAVYQALLPMFESSFIFDSYSCREGKGTHRAVERLGMFARKVSDNYSGPCWALKFDVRKFFDSVDHEILLGILEKKLSHEMGSVPLFQLLSDIVGSYESRFADRGGVTKWPVRTQNRIADWQPDVTAFRERLHGRIRPFYQRRSA